MPGYEKMKLFSVSGFVPAENAADDVIHVIFGTSEYAVSSDSAYLCGGIAPVMKIMGGEYDGGAGTITQFPEGAQYGYAVFCVKKCRRFIQKQYRGFAYECGCYPRLLELAVAQCGNVLIGDMADSKLLQGIFKRLLVLDGQSSAHVCLPVAAYAHEFLQGESACLRDSCRYHHYILGHGCQGLEKRCLAASVRSAQHDAVSLAYVEAYAAAKWLALVPDCQVSDFQQCLFHNTGFLMRMYNIIGMPTRAIVLAIGTGAGESCDMRSAPMLMMAPVMSVAGRTVLWADVPNAALAM